METTMTVSHRPHWFIVTDASLTKRKRRLTVANGRKFIQNYTQSYRGTTIVVNGWGWCEWFRMNGNGCPCERMRRNPWIVFSHLQISIDATRNVSMLYGVVKLKFVKSIPQPHSTKLNFLRIFSRKDINAMKRWPRRSWIISCQVLLDFSKSTFWKN